MNQSWRRTAPQPSLELPNRFFWWQRSREIRSRRFFENARGNLGRIFKISSKSAISSWATKGPWPWASSKVSTPSIQKSTPWLWPSLRRISGARYSGVPHMVHLRGIQIFNPTSM